ncbi:SUMO-interacting motif-containing protein 1 isoform X2 [Bombina bombina]|uniref:SUMO-interacting motif-containing protein 1 isoform X2 n=1 Tax=Bombina bombina TaxID=8345 RepID=UPI00235AA677|nr:SUMO-interacting motif-containing protein 1 isoform X2 [Bombina bombina]
MTNLSFALIKCTPYNMDDFIIISDGSDSENAFPRASSENDVFKFRKKRKKTGSNNWLRSPPNTSTPMRTNVKPLIKPLPIPSRRMNIVSHTVEEDFPRGTLHYLTEFVSPHHYPPTAHQYPSLDPPILCHIIRSILLGAQEPGIMNEAYTFLMKVQELHPVKLSTVPWDWNLFTEMMEKEKHPARLLFLQYVVQTLDDDFQLHVQRRSLQKCLAKSMLSCDKSFANIRDIVKWLVDSLKNVTEVCTAEYDHNTMNDHQKVTCLLQRMLSIAVEVDQSPTCSSNKIAGFMFTYVLSINSRHQREMFLKSIESTLLRAKLLDVMFQHSCELPPTLPLSLSKILYFIDHSTLLLEERSRGKEWQRWDEMLHHLCLLFFSYQRIMPEHLRTPVTERIDCILQSTQAHMPNEDLDITEADVEFCLNNFKTRTLGSEIPQTIQAKLNLLYSLFCTTIKNT